MKFDNATILAAGVLACMKDYQSLFAANGRSITFEQIIEDTEQTGRDMQAETEKDETASNGDKTKEL